MAVALRVMFSNRPVTATSCLGFSLVRFQVSSCHNQTVKLLTSSTGLCLQATSSKSGAGMDKILKSGKATQALVINKNMHLRLCNSAATTASLPQPAPNDSEQTGRPLVVFLSWLMAREKYLEKYRSIYFSHGFDVLTVKTSPTEFLFPTKGSQRVAKNLLEFLKNQVSTYPNVVVHGFSVGAYQFSELLVMLEQGLYSKDGADGSCEIVRKSIKGMVFDSAVGVEGAPHGVAKSLAGDTIFANAIENAIKGYMKLLYPIATKHYIKAHKTFINMPLRCPALLLVSRDDKLGNPQSNELARDRWKELGVDVTWKCWEKSRHVAHFQKYPQEYVSMVEDFLERINLINRIK